MTAIASHPVNIRKRRLMEAFKEDMDDRESQRTKTATVLDLSTTKEEPTTPPTPKVTTKKLESIDKDQSKIIEMKLKVLETWEISKRKGIEKLVKDVEELQMLEDKIEKLEEILLSRNLIINEKEFEEFYESKMLEEPPMEPLEVLHENQPSTPKRQEQQQKRVKISATSTPITRKPIKTELAERFVANAEGMVVIGPNGTEISKMALISINWSLSGAALTRKILMGVFDRETLAFHTLTGKPSPAFMDCDKPMKNQLDPLKVADIIHLVTQYTSLSPKEVRNAITTKCADENKMFRQREKKRLSAASKLEQQQLPKPQEVD